MIVAYRLVTQWSMYYESYIGNTAQVLVSSYDNSKDHISFGYPHKSDSVPTARKVAALKYTGL